MRWRGKGGKFMPTLAINCNQGALLCKSSIDYACYNRIPYQINIEEQDYQDLTKYHYTSIVQSVQMLHLIVHRSSYSGQYHFCHLSLCL